MSLATGHFPGFDLSLREPGIAWFEFNTPERLNGMTASIKRDLIECITQAQMDDAVRVLVFTGKGKAFCAGDDLKGYRDGKLEGKPLTAPIHPGHHHPGGTYNGLRTNSQALNTALRNLDKITIAAINGVAIQTGLSLALSCDFRIAARSARLGSATLRFGLLPDEGGHYLLVQQLGLSRALEFVLRKKIVEADEAKALGLVNEVVDSDALVNTAMAWASEFAQGPQLAMRMLKRSMYNAAEQTWAHALEDIAARTAVTDHHPDAKEGAAAFREKRAPKFNTTLS